MARPGTFVTGQVITKAELDALGRVYTSSTRPTGSDLYEGLDIYETDTDRRLEYDGTGWVIMAEPWQTYTPTLTGMAIGTGGSASNVMSYHRSDGCLDFQWAATFGTSGATFPTNPTFSLPVAMTDAEVGFLATYVDGGVARYAGIATSNALGSLFLQVFGAAYTGLTTTTPFTWGAGDHIHVRGRYRMTTRYS